MRKFFIAAATVAAVLAFAGTAAAASGNGAVRIDDAGCTTYFFGTTCTVVRSTTNTTTTPSGNISYVINGTVERTTTFVFGGSYTFTDELHLHGLRKAGEVHEESDHYWSQWVYASGTYNLTCVEAYDLHWANDASQIGNFELYCV